MAGRNYNNNGDDGERYERYNFDATEDDYIVSDILINLEALICNSNSKTSYQPQPVTCSRNSYEPEPTTCSLKLTSCWAIKARNPLVPRWQKKKKRSALDNPPSPPRVVKKNENLRIRDVKIGDKKQEILVYSPSSPLNYEPNEDKNNYSNIQSTHQLKNNSKKRKLKDWEKHVEELEQTRQQLKLSLDNVKRYHQTLLELNTKLKAKRDEMNGESKRKSLQLQEVKGEFDLNFQTGHHQFAKLPVFARQQQQHDGYTHQQGGSSITFQYFPVPFFQANDKVLQAAEARHRRKIKINTKKISNSLGGRSSIS